MWFFAGKVNSGLLLATFSNLGSAIAPLARSGCVLFKWVLYFMRSCWRFEAGDNRAGAVDCGDLWEGRMCLIWHRHIRPEEGQVHHWVGHYLLITSSTDPGNKWTGSNSPCPNFTFCNLRTSAHCSSSCRWGLIIGWSVLGIFPHLLMQKSHSRIQANQSNSSHCNRHRLS